LIAKNLILAANDLPRAKKIDELRVTRAVGMWAGVRTSPADRGGRGDREIVERKSVMKKTFELWSQLLFRISAIALVGLLAVLTFRDQNRPPAVDVQDTRYLEKMETYIKVEKARSALARPQVVDDQRGFRATPHAFRAHKTAAACIRS
jgi:hypothetical protein